MNFELDAEQIEIQRMVRLFTAQEITPYATLWDEQHIFPRPVYQKMAELGLLGLTTPEEYGGNPLPRLTAALVYEELAKGDMATSGGLSVHNMVTGLLARFGSEEQCQRWVSRLATGELLGAFSLSEVGSGSDAASLQCRAEKQADGSYLLNGSKAWVTNGGEADLYLVMARTDFSHSDEPEKRARGISSFVVEKGTPGFSFGKTERKMGLHSSPTRELVFSNCVIPADQLVGKEGQGYKIALSSLNGGRINIGAITVGVAQAAFAVATAYARERVQFGQPIGAFQGIQFLLADMAMKIEAARLLVYQAAYKLDQAAGDPGKENAMAQYASMAKCFATDKAMEVTTDAVQVLGGAGYVSDYPVERYMRDVKVAQIFEGTNQIQRMIIGRALLGDLSV